MKITAKIQQLDVPSGNNRVYPADAFAETIAQVNSGKRILFGTIGAPQALAVEMDLVSHQVTNLRVEDGYLVADITVLDTPQGEVLKRAIEAVDEVGATRVQSPAFRPAGTGIVAVTDGQHVVKDYKLISIDFLYDPA